MYRSIATVLGALTATACLANDPRPPPGSLLVTASPDSAITAGLSTDDGWSIEYDRFLVSLGNASAEDDNGSCNHTYSDPTYQRVLELKQGSAQKINLVFALGACTIDLELSSPHDDSPLGKGVTPADRDFMRTPQSDDFVKNAGVSIHAAGRASKAGAEKRFAWSFRNRIDYTNIAAERDGNLVHGVHLGENDEQTLDVKIRGDVLFQSSSEPNGATSFDVFASADDTLGDADGEITLSELGKVSVTGSESLERYLYDVAFRRVVDANALEQDVVPNDRNPF